MPSKISLVNKEIWKTITRSVGWVSIIYLLGLFFSIPLAILLTSPEERRQFVRAENLFQYNFEIQTFLYIGIPVLMAIFLFRYLQIKSYSDLMHSLPVKREAIYHQYAISGLILLILPVLFTALTVLTLYQPLQLADFYTITDIFKWVGITIMYMSFIYMAGVFVGMVTGLSAVQGALTFIILLLPMGLMVLISFNLPFFLYGFPNQYYMESKFEAFSPLISASLLNYRDPSEKEIFSYLFLTAILYWLSLWVYRKRKLEAVSQALVFPVLKPIFKYGATFCTMLLGGMYFGEMRGGTGWLIAGYVVGALLGYFIAEMVLQKSWRVSIRIKGLLVYTAVIAVLVILFQFDFTQYEKNIPGAYEIERVHLSGSYYQYSDMELDKPLYLNEPESIDFVRRLHKEIIANKSINGLITGRNDYAFIVYELKNGEKIVRNYVIDKRRYKPFYKLIEESDEYKQAVNEIYQVNANDTSKITITPSGPLNKRATITDPADLKEAVELLKEEVDSATYEQSRNEKEPYAFIEILYGDNKKASMEWRRSYKQLEAWLEEKGLLDQAKVTAADVGYALVMRTEDLDINYSRGFSYEEIFADMEQSKLALKITDKQQLGASLENSRGFIEGEYIIGFYFTEQREVDIRNFSRDDAPEFIKNYFE